MHDWTYESLIGKLKAALAEVEKEPDPSARPSSQARPKGGHEPSAAKRRADTTDGAAPARNR